MSSSSSSPDVTQAQNPATGPNNGSSLQDGLKTASNSGAHKEKGLLVGLGVASAVFILLAAFLVVRLINRHNSNEEDSPLQKEGIALFFEESQVLFGKENKLHMRVRVPRVQSSSNEAKDSNVIPAIAIKDDQNRVLSKVESTSMRDTGDGYMWAELEVNVPATEAGTVSLIAESVDESEESSSEVVLPVVREGVEAVPAGSEWLLSEVCDWADENCGSEKQASDAAKLLLEHLKSDDRILEAKQYGTTVMFTAKETGILYCISFEPLGTESLGTSTDNSNHTFSQTDPILHEFTSAGANGKTESGDGITAGNTITNGNILLLEPTPELMDKASTEQVKKACDAYAKALNESKVTIAQEDEALRSLLRGDVYDAGVLVLRAHGIGGETPLFLVQSKRKNTASGWESIQKGLHDYIGSFVDCTIQDPGTLFCGLASEPQSWRCAVTACMDEEPGTWNVGISMAPNLLRNRYSSKPLDNCMIWLSVCGSLADNSLDSWAAEKSYGVGIIAGYEGSVSQAADAQHVSDFLTWITSSSSKASSWRCVDVGEALDKMNDVTLKGNENIFAKGAGILEGKVINEEKNSVDGATVTAWRYFNEGFLSQKEVTSGKDGAFKFEGLPSGRYVVVAQKDDQYVKATIVLDDDSIDGGSVQTSASTPEPEPIADLGVLNGGFAADTDYLHLGIGSNGQENGTQPKPKIVRVKRADESNTEVIWEGPENGYIHEVLQTKDRLLVQFSSWSKQDKTFVMKKNGEEAKEIGSTKSYSGYSIPMVTDGDKVAYATKEGDKWVLRICSLDGSNDQSIYEWKPNGNASPTLGVLGIEDKNVYFYTSESSASNTNNIVVGNVPVVGGTNVEVMKKEQVSTPALVGERLYYMEGNEFVSYLLSGKDRKVVASLPAEAKGAWIWNMNNHYAFIVSYGGTWRVNLETSETEKVGGSEQFATIGMVDDMIVASFIDDSKEVWDLNLKTQRKLWPSNTKKTEPEPAPVEEPPAPSTPSPAADPIAANEAQAGASVVWSSTGDFDGDGTKETLAVVGDWYGTAAFNGSDAWNNASLWFVSSNGDVSLVKAFDRITYVNNVFQDPDGSGYTLLSLEKMTGTASSASCVFGVQNGVPVEISVVGSNVQLHNGQIIISKSYYAQGGGRRLDWRSLSFDPASFTLIEGSTIADTGNFELP